jgi:hypothetical protein
MPPSDFRHLASNRQPQTADMFGDFANLPLPARVNDRLADAMIAIDEAMQMCELEGDTYEASWLGPQVLAAYDQVNCIMKKISD